MTPIEDLVPRALIYCRKAPEPVIARFLLEAARDYCAIMPVWTELDTLEIYDPSLEILSSIGDAEIVSIEHATFEDRKIEPITLGELDDKHPNWMTDTDEGAARYITQMGPGSVMVYPRETGTLAMRLHLMPSIDAENLPDVLATKFADVIIRGAVGKMMVLPDTEYTNPSLGTAHLAFFASKTTIGAKIRAKSGQQRAPIRTKPRFF